MQKTKDDEETKVNQDHTILERVQQPTNQTSINTSGPSTPKCKSPSPTIRNLSAQREMDNGQVVLNSQREISGEGQVNGVGIDMRPSSPSMMAAQGNDSSVPVLEATLVEDSPEEPVYNAVAIRATDTDNDNSQRLPCWKRHQKASCVVLVLAVLVALATALGAIFASQGKDEDTPVSLLYYAKWDSKSCDNDPLGQPDANLRQRLFDTVQECCEAE